MEYYKQVIRDKFDDLCHDNETPEEILKRWSEGDTEDDFGNLSGSRTFSAYEAEEALKEAGFPWDSELNDLLTEVGYNVGELLDKGAEFIDVVLCELIVPYVIDELKEKMEQ